jgi:hypothetical protein
MVLLRYIYPVRPTSMDHVAFMHMHIIDRWYTDVGSYLVPEGPRHVVAHACTSRPWRVKPPQEARSFFLFYYFETSEMIDYRSKNPSSIDHIFLEYFYISLSFTTALYCRGFAAARAPETYIIGPIPLGVLTQLPSSRPKPALPGESKNLHQSKFALISCETKRRGRQGQLPNNRQEVLLMLMPKTVCAQRRTRTRPPFTSKHAVY